MNPSQSVLVLEGDDIESFNRAVQQVTYRNSLRFATPGVRPLKLSTSLRYKNTKSVLCVGKLEKINFTTKNSECGASSPANWTLP